MKKNSEKTNIERALNQFKKLDKEDFYFVDAKLKCPYCIKEFGIDREYVGVITCPYCGKYVEG